VKRPKKRNHVVPAGGELGELQRGLIGLGSRVAEKRPVGPRHRNDAGHFLAEPCLQLVIEIGPRHVQELLRLLDNRLHHIGM
jgi:hypothetical protein